MKTYNELVDYYRNTTVEQAIEDLYIDLVHRTETINKLSRKIQKLKKQLKKEQELKVFQYEMKVQSYEELIKLQERIDKAIKYIVWYKTSNNDSNLGLTKLECEALINILGGKE